MIAFENNEQLISRYAAILKESLSLKTDSERFSYFEKATFNSLKKESIAKDLEFLLEINAILQRILTISRKPHLFIIDTDIILRSEEISTFSNEKFQKTLKQSELWGRKEDMYSPEYAYATEYLDFYQIYENIMVKMCLDRIEGMINRGLNYYRRFIGDLTGFALDDYSYTSPFSKTSKTIIEENVFQDNPEVLRIIEKLELLTKKIRRIKETYYYKALRTAKPIQGPIVVTNIIRDNRNYNYVFRFYKRLVKATSSSDILDAKRGYLLKLLVAAIQSNGFTLKKSGLIFNSKTVKLSYAGDLFSLVVTQKEDEPFLITVRANNNRLLKAVSSLDIYRDDKTYSDVQGVDAFSYVYDDYTTYRYQNGTLCVLKQQHSQNEVDVVATMIASLVNAVSASREIYEHYCPVCGAKTLHEISKDVYGCWQCQSEHAFIVNSEEKPFVWIKKLNMEDGV